MYKISSKSFFTIFFVANAWALSSCQFFYRKIYGINKNPCPNCWTTDKAGIPPHSLIAQSNSNYLSYLKDSLQFNTEQIKRFYQPLQVLFYNEQGELILYAANCLVGGFPNLKWSAIHFFEIPKDTGLKPTYYPPLSGVIRSTDNGKDFQSKGNKTLIVFWNYYMGRQSKRFIKYLKRELEKREKDSVRVIWINNDAWFK